jgi:hypothetical protein
MTFTYAVFKTMFQWWILCLIGNVKNRIGTECQAVSGN